MFFLSIVLELIFTIEYAIAFSSISFLNISLKVGLIFFESFSLSFLYPFGKITAEAVTVTYRLPLPASSTPAS